MFNNYLKKNTNSYEVYFNRAVCYYKLHKYKKAINDLTFIIKELKDNNNDDKANDIKKNPKSCEDENEDEDEINEKMKKNILEENDGELWAEIYFLRSKSYINLNQIDDALKDINNFFELIELEKNKIKKDNTKLNDDKNKENKNIKDKEDLDLKVEKIIFKKYDISEAHFKKGYCLLTLLDYNSALKEFEKAIKIDPSYVTAYFNIGLCYYNMNNKKYAIKYFSKILEYYPLDIEAFINLVKCHREMGNSKNSFDLLVKKIPDFLKKEKNFVGKIPKLYYETGMSLLRMEKYEEAKNYFKKCRDYETNKNHKNDIQLISECYSKEGECISKLNETKNSNDNNSYKEN
jgi:tetratricopeptide (TPR) repeat protein